MLYSDLVMFYRDWVMSLSEGVMHVRDWVVLHINLMILNSDWNRDELCCSVTELSYLVTVLYPVTRYCCLHLFCYPGQINHQNLTLHPGRKIRFCNS